ADSGLVASFSISKPHDVLQRQTAADAVPLVAQAERAGFEYGGFCNSRCVASLRGNYFCPPDLSPSGCSSSFPIVPGCGGGQPGQKRDNFFPRVLFKRRPLQPWPDPAPWPFQPALPMSPRRRRAARRGGPRRREEVEAE